MAFNPKPEASSNIPQQYIVSQLHDPCLECTDTHSPLPLPSRFFFHWFLWEGGHVDMVSCLTSILGVALPLWVFAYVEASPGVGWYHVCCQAS